MTEADEGRLIALNARLQSCEDYCLEPSLKPLHLAAAVSLQGELAVALREAVGRLYGYRGQGQLLLGLVDDWQLELERLPLFDAGFGVPPADDAGRAGLRREIALVLDAALGSSPTIWRLDSNDSEGSRLVPAGGLSLFFVFESAACRVLLEIAWDS